MRNKTNLKTIFTPAFPSSWAQLHPWILCLLPSAAQGNGDFKSTKSEFLNYRKTLHVKTEERKLMDHDF